MENMDFALQVMVLGFLVVMVTLFGLYGLLVLFNRLLYRPSPVATGTQEKEISFSSQEDSKAENKRVVAAIQAAIYQYMQTDQASSQKGPISFTVHTPEKTGLNKWQIIGRREQLESSLELENIRRKKKRENI